MEEQDLGKEARDEWGYCHIHLRVKRSSFEEFLYRYLLDHLETYYLIRLLNAERPTHLPPEAAARQERSNCLDCQEGLGC